jgi:hypothetical protein
MRTLDLIGRSTVIDMLGLLTLDFQKLYMVTGAGDFEPRFSKAEGLGHNSFILPWDIVGATYTLKL